MQPALTDAARPGDTSRSTAARVRAAAGPLPWLAVVASLFAAAQLALVVPGLGLGWDETVYVSQVGGHAPAAFFSAPRARGISLLVAPVAALTDSVTVLRCFLAVLSAAGLYLGLHVWRRLLPDAVVALAGALFASLWITLFYGPQAMPNLWVALAALTGVGCFLRHTRDRADRRALYGAGCAVAVAALMRPTDGVWLAAPLILAALAVPSWRRSALPLVLAAGAALGAAEWVAEAYASYGGLAARLDRASEIQGGLGWHPAFAYHLRALDGRALCRPCDVPWRDHGNAVWWLALPLLVAGGVAAAACDRRLDTVLPATLTGLSLAAPYLLTVDYAAPRFLLPAYALLVLPVALLLTDLVTTAPRRGRPLAAAAVAAVLVAHGAGQLSVLRGTVARASATATSLGRTAAALGAAGVRPPCTVSGAEAVRIAFLAGCASRQPGGHDGSLSVPALRARAAAQPVAVMVAPGRTAPAYAKDWRTVPMPSTPGRAAYRAYVSPAPPGTGPEQPAPGRTTGTAGASAASPARSGPAGNGTASQSTRGRHGSEPEGASHAADRGE